MGSTLSQAKELGRNLGKLDAEGAFDTMFRGLSEQKRDIKEIKDFFKETFGGSKPSKSSPTEESIRRHETETVEYGGGSEEKKKEKETWGEGASWA